MPLWKPKNIYTVAAVIGYNYNKCIIITMVCNSSIMLINLETYKRF